MPSLKPVWQTSPNHFMACWRYRHPWPHTPGSDRASLQMVQAFEKFIQEALCTV
jgi:hypothetical protein